MPLLTSKGGEYMASSALGQAIKETRQQAGKTALQVASELPADHTTVFRYEAKGKVPAESMARIGTVLRSLSLLNRYCMECPVGQEKERMRAEQEGNCMTPGPKKKPHRAWWSQIKINLRK